MADGKPYVNVKFVRTGPQSPSSDGMDTERIARRIKLDSRIWLICVLTATLIITGICWGIHVSQIRQSLKQMHSDLRHQFTEMETKYRSVNKTKAQICELLTSRRDQTCSQDWIRNEDRCYFISMLATSYEEAKESCSTFDGRLLKISSKEKENFVSNALVHQHRTYWIGKCEDGEEASSLMYTLDNGTSICGTCDSSEWKNHCNHQHPFICEKLAHWCTNIPEKIQDLCQQFLRTT